MKTNKLPPILLVIMSLSVLVACSNTSLPTQTRSPSEEDISGFVQLHKLNVVGRKNTDTFTILLFENAMYAGHYLLYRGYEDKLYNSLVQADYDKETKVFLGGVATQNPFVTAIINDEGLFESADKAQVVFEDGTKVKENISDRGIVFVYPGIVEKPLNYIGFEIYDSAGNVLYKTP